MAQSQLLSSEDWLHVFGIIVVSSIETTLNELLILEVRTKTFKIALLVDCCLRRYREMFQRTAAMSDMYYSLSPALLQVRNLMIKLQNNEQLFCNNHYVIHPNNCYSKMLCVH